MKQNTSSKHLGGETFDKGKHLNKEEASPRRSDIGNVKTEEQTPDGELTNFQILYEYWKLALPASVCRLCFQISFVSLFIAKDFNDTKKMAGIGLGTSMMVLCKVYLFGIGQPIETLTAITYGHGDMRLCGLYLYRTILVSTGAFIPVIFFISFSKPILLGIGQDPEVVEHAGEFL